MDICRRSLLLILIPLRLRSSLLDPRPILETNHLPEFQEGDGALPRGACVLIGSGTICVRASNGRGLSLSLSVDSDAAGLTSQPTFRKLLVRLLTITPPHPTIRHMLHVRLSCAKLVLRFSGYVTWMMFGICL